MFNNGTAFTHEYRVNVSSLSDPTNPYTVDLGFGNNWGNASSTSESHAAKFVYDKSTSGANWWTSTKAASVQTAMDTGIPVVEGNNDFVTLKIEVPEQIHHN